MGDFFKNVMVPAITVVTALLAAWVNYWTVTIESGVIRRAVSKYFHFTRLGCLLYWRMYRMSFLFRSATEVKTPRAMTSRSILANHSSTWLSQEEYVGVKCI